MPSRKTTVVAALILLVPAALLTNILKGAMLTHVLVQFPALVAAGALLGSSIGCRTKAPLAPTINGVTAVILAGFSLSFWMLPRWLDAAALSLRIDALKIASLVLLVGVPLGWGWCRITFLARAFIWANVATMLGVLGTLYVTFPGRLCNTYLVDEQVALGWIMLAAALSLTVAGALRALVGDFAAANLTSDRASPGSEVLQTPL